MPPRAGKLRKTPHGNAERNFEQVCHFGYFLKLTAYKGLFFVCRCFHFYRQLRTFLIIFTAYSKYVKGVEDNGNRKRGTKRGKKDRGLCLR